jgi:hypothetical protein
MESMRIPAIPVELNGKTNRSNGGLSQASDWPPPPARHGWFTDPAGSPLQDNAPAACSSRPIGVCLERQVRVA